MKSYLVFALLLALISVARTQDQRVVLDFYTESLCPDCINFFLNSFQQAVNTPNFTQICLYTDWPYGNAKEQ